MRTENLHATLAREEDRLASLEREVAEVRSRIAAIRTELSQPASPPAHLRSLPLVPDEPAHWSVSQKLSIFRGLFRGREDVFPKLWTSRKGPAEKKGYSPACRNEWVRGVCEKPKVKCGECRNQAFLSLTDQVLLEHLQGRHVIGIYPLLKDETCWLLAADFDKKAWMEDVAAFIETCHRAGVRPAVERSRSGNGAHVWFFFAEPIPALTARKMGCFFLTETMARRHQLSMDSYDRLFPNQDTMPRGGFGNLIALPLQHGPRQHGNTVFLNDKLVPEIDQWAHLACIQRLSAAQVEAIATEAAQRNLVLDVRVSLTEEEEATPWMKPPSGRPRRVEIVGDLPKEVRVVLGQRVFIEKVGLPSTLLNQIKRLAAFQNSEFYKKQSMRLSTASTPRVITCAEEMEQHVALPRGCLDELIALLNEHGVGVVLNDQRNEGDRTEFRFHGCLSALQEQAVGALLEHDIGIFVAPPGMGKTVVGTYLLAQRGRNTLVLVHRKPLLDQWIAQLSNFLRVDPKEIGQVGGGKHKPTGRLDVAMMQSLVRKGAVNDLVANYGHIIVDECHHLPAVSFERVLAEVKARYVTGLTATPYRRDGHQAIIHMQCGPIRYAVKPKTPDAQSPFRHRLICRGTHFRSDSLDRGSSISDVYTALAANEERNQIILDDVVRSIQAGRSPILLTERRDHLEYFNMRLRPFVRHLILLHGGMSTREVREVTARLDAIPEGTERLILATGRYVGEGFDDARLDTLFLALPIAWKGTLVQYAGRLHRFHPRKPDVCIFDYVDREVPVLARMFEKRLRGYRSMGYLLEQNAGMAVFDSEWDEDGLRSDYDVEDGEAVE